MEVIKHYQGPFSFELPSVTLARRILMNFWPHLVNVATVLCVTPLHVCNGPVFTVLSSLGSSICIRVKPTYVNITS